MISAELNHNPYLLQTSVRFYGRPPRINSQIEKYEGRPLKDWAAKVPDIFYHEMNGFDFDLQFEGTHSDYEEVRRAFADAGIPETEVRMVHKSIIGDAEAKSAEIDDLLGWLRDVPNRKFNFPAFWEKHTELFEGKYPYIIVQGSVPESMPDMIGAESVESAGELAGTDLTNTPILFCVTPQYAEPFRRDLETILKRADIRKEQLFFRIDPRLNREQQIRIISDIGNPDPQIVSSPVDERIMSYLRSYAMTDYVREAIVAFREVYGTLAPVIQSENQKSMAANAAAHSTIRRIERELFTLKRTQAYFMGAVSYVPPEDFSLCLQKLTDDLRKWQSKQTKLNGHNEAKAAAAEYNKYVNHMISDAMTQIISCWKKAAADILSMFTNAYKAANVDVNFCPNGVHASESWTVSSVSLEDELLALKQIKYENAKSDIFDIFRKPEDTKKSVEIVTCYLSGWRERAIELVVPEMKSVIDGHVLSLSRYYTRLATAYQKHIEELIQDRERCKSEAALHLSADEQQIQADSDWLTKFDDRLTHIERG